MRQLSGFSVLALLACSGSATPVAEQPPIKGSAEPVAHSSDCIVRGPDPDPGPGIYPPSADSITIAGDEVTFCWDVKPLRSCWRVDVTKGMFTALPVITHAPGKDTPRFAQRPRAKATPRPDGTIALCAPGGAPCKSFQNPGPTAEPEFVGVSDDLATVAIPDGNRLRIYDVAKARLRTTIKGWPDSPMPSRFHYPPTFATPDRMIVWYSWTPVSEQGRIFDMSGKQLAIVGDEFASIGPDINSWLVQGSEWVIKGEGNTILTVDVQNPKLTSTIDITTLLAQPRPPPDADTHILDVEAISGTAKRLVIVTSENPPTIGVLDRTTKKLARLQPPICPP